MHCGHCGNFIPDESLVCGYCGHKIREPEEVLTSEINNMNVPENGTEDTIIAGQSDQASIDDPMVDISADELDKPLNLEEEEEIHQQVIHNYTVEQPLHQQEVSSSVPLIHQADQTEQPGQTGQEQKYDVVLPTYKDKRMRPIRTSGFFWTKFVLLIPIMNIILLFIWAFRERSNVNRKAYARAVLIWLLLILIAVLAGLIAMLVMRMPMDINYWITQLKNWVNSIPAF